MPAIKERNGREMGKETKAAGHFDILRGVQPRSRMPQDTITTIMY